MFNPEDESKEKEDWFETPAPEEDDTPKAPKAPEPTPDEPDYWEREESEWEHLKPRRRGRFYAWLVVAGVVIGVIVSLWLTFFRPAVEGAVAYGYVEQIQHEGLVFMTYEGTVLPYRELLDTNRVYTGDFIFSTPNDTLAADIRRLEKTGTPVRMEYNVYRQPLPWRGRQRIVVTSVEKADPRAILPPEFQPEYIPQ